MTPNGPLTACPFRKFARVNRFAGEQGSSFASVSTWKADGQPRA